MNEFSCVLCNHHRFIKIKSKVRDSEKKRIVKCSKCGHVQIYPLPSIDDDKEFYDKDMQSKNINRDMDIEYIKKKSMYDVERRKQLILEIVDKEFEILEIGCGYGFLINELEEAGFNIDGIEISNSRRKIAKKICKGNIYDINLMKDDIPKYLEHKYDAILLFQVLEHIVKPKKFIENNKKLLKDEGIIIVEVPNLNDHLLNLCSQYNEFFWQRAHISYFTPSILINLFKELGFEDINVFGVQRYSIVNMMNWYINGVPQIEEPIYEILEDDLKWIDEYYKCKLVSELKSDTLVLIAKI